MTEKKTKSSSATKKTKPAATKKKAPKKAAVDKEVVKTPEVSYQVGEHQVILRFYRLVDAFCKADEERDFYLDRTEGFILYGDLSKSDEDLEKLFNELKKNSSRYIPIPKLTFYEQKKIMEAFVNEKVYDIDTKEKLLDLVASKGSRQNFLEFLVDHLPELEKWQQFFLERFRIRIIEWLRQNNYSFVFEEDLELGQEVVERVKQYFFSKEAPKEVLSARKTIGAKSKTYYSTEALNPRPKRGRPPKQTAKVEVEIQLSKDIYNKVPSGIYTFIYAPEIDQNSQVTFSETHTTHDELVASLRQQDRHSGTIARLEELSSRLTRIDR